MFTRNIFANCHLSTKFSPMNISCYTLCPTGLHSLSCTPVAWLPLPVVELLHSPTCPASHRVSGERSEGVGLGLRKAGCLRIRQDSIFDLKKARASGQNTGKATNLFVNWYQRATLFSYRGESLWMSQTCATKKLNV